VEPDDDYQLARIVGGEAVIFSISYSNHPEKLACL
jgi:hypothetical protein